MFPAFCDGIDRRGFLRVGSLAGLSLAQFFRLQQAAGASLPPYISVPCFLRSGGHAFLGAGCAPFVIDADPAAPDFSVRDVVLPEKVTADRNLRRQAALRTLHRFERRVEEGCKDVRALD